MNRTYRQKSKKKREKIEREISGQKSERDAQFGMSSTYSDALYIVQR